MVNRMRKNAIHLPLDGIEQEFYDFRQPKRFVGWEPTKNK